MKILTYLIAVAALLAGAYFSYDVKTKFTELKANRLELAETNTRREGTIEKTKKKAGDTEELRDAAQVALSETEGELRTKEENTDVALRDKATLDEKIAGQVEEIKDVQTLIDTVENAFSALDVDMEDIPNLIKGLEEDVATNTTKSEELTTLVSSVDKRIETTSEALSSQRKRISDRAERIKANTLEGHVTAIDHNWGIAIVNVPSKMPLDISSKLLVRRGSSYIGRLKISSIEGSRVITDIDYKSMSSGIVLQQGDTVFLETLVIK